MSPEEPSTPPASESAATEISPPVESTPVEPSPIPAPVEPVPAEPSSNPVPVEPTSVAPVPVEPPSPSASADSPPTSSGLPNPYGLPEIAVERPEVAAGAAFAGGLVLALILKRLGR